MFIYKVEYYCGDGSEEVFTFSDHCVAAGKYKEILNDKLKDHERYGTLSMWSEELDAESKEFIKNGLHRILHFSDIDYDALLGPEFMEKLDDAIDSGFGSATERAEMGFTGRHSTGRFMASAGTCQLHLLGFKDGYKIRTIKAVREHVVGIGLKEAKEFVEHASSDSPSVIDGLSSAMANDLAKELSEVAHYRVDY